VIYYYIKLGYVHQKLLLAFSKSTAMY